MTEYRVQQLEKHFNSHAHVERDRVSVYPYQQRFHFNSHAHVERDNAGEEVKVRFVNFNSQAHVERDQGMERRIIMTKISTHTLTWSVTRSSAGRPDRTEYFNSHAHVERDISIFSRFSLFAIFQLTRSRGA